MDGIDSTANGFVTAFVMTKMNRLPPASMILAAIKLVLGDGMKSWSAEWKDGILIFESPLMTLAVTAIDAPYFQWDDLDRPCARAWKWPEATAQMRAHQSYFMLICKGGTIDAVERRVLLTHIIRVVVEASDAIGVFWPEGSLVHEASAFKRDSADASVDVPPAFLWVGTQFQVNRDNTLSCVSTGLSAFGLMEFEVIETRTSLEKLYFLIYDMIIYVIKDGIHLKHRATIGWSMDEQFSVRHARSRFRKGKVVRLLIP